MNELNTVLLKFRWNGK